MKKINIFSLIAILAITVFLFVCSPTEPEKPYLFVQKLKFNFTKNVTSEKLIISNTGEGKLSWQITSKPDWIEVSKSSGTVTTSRDTVVITANVNQEIGTYSGTITIKSNGGNIDVAVYWNASVWTKMADMPTANVYFGACVLSWKIYVIGGAPDPSKVFSSLAVYEPATDTWTTKPSMKNKRAFLSACVVAGKIYAIGGTQAFGDFARGLEYMEMYDPLTDMWTDKAPMQQKRFGFAASVVNGKIYAIGGTYDGINFYPTVEEYDPSSDSWTYKSDMPTQRAYFSTSVVDGKIYAIGGSGVVANGLSTVEVYDPDTDTWAQKAPMPTPRNALATCVVDGKIYAIGGERGVSGFPGLTIVERYDPITDSWTIMNASMPTPRRGLSINLVKGIIYAIGGTVGAGGSSMRTVEAYDPELDFPANVK